MDEGGKLDKGGQVVRSYGFLRRGFYDLCLNLFTKNRTHQIRSAGPERPGSARSLDATYRNFIRFYIRAGASDKKMPHDISRFYTRPLLP